MKNFFLFFLATNLFLASSAQSSSHVVLISIDGFLPGFYLDSAWPTTNLQRLMKHGVYATQMKSVFPSYTYPAHVAMITGALPARSGIYYNAKAGSSDWNWFAKEIRVPTIWQALHEVGMTSAVVEWPVSVGADVDYSIPEIWDSKHPEDRITEVRKYATPNLIEEIEQNATGKLDSSTMNEEYLSFDENAGRMAAYIFKKFKPNLLCVHFACVDGAMHEQGRGGYKVREAIQTADRAVGNILETIERSGLQGSTTVIIVGDHGFININSFIRPNIWLLKKNLLKNGSGKGAYFVAAGGSAFLYIDGSNSRSTLDSVQEMIKELPEEQRKLFTVVQKSELDKMGVDSNAKLALAAVPGTVFSGSSKGELTGNSQGGHHGYNPDFAEMKTGFIAAGAGVRDGGSIEQLCVTDISPLIGTLLGIQFKPPDGKLIPGILK